MRTSAKILSGAAALILVASPAVAGESSGTMIVGSTVLEACTIVAGPMTFGDISLSGSAHTTTATLTLACTPNADFDILMNDGANADSGQRRMANLGKTEFIPYDIYLDDGHLQRWGNTIGTDTKSGAANALGVASYTAYGQIEGDAAAVTAGAYTDTVTVTVDF